MSSQLRSALFIDFDNVFSGLIGLEPQAAVAFGQSPSDWLRRLSSGSLDGATRRFLLRRCYMNPSGWVSHGTLGDDRGRLFYSRFRPYFTRAGFEVIDCPSLTNRHKNAADIRIVLDAMELVTSPVGFDEIVIASSDADFTPLLHRLRARDLRTTIISTGQTAPAYESVADVFLDEQRIVDLVLGVDTEPDEPSAVDDNREDVVTRLRRRSLLSSGEAMRCPRHLWRSLKNA